MSEVKRFSGDRSPGWSGLNVEWRLVGDSRLSCKLLQLKVFEWDDDVKDVSLELWCAAAGLLRYPWPRQDCLIWSTLLSIFPQFLA